jgi:hypothetical protein
MLSLYLRSANYRKFVQLSLHRTYLCRQHRHLPLTTNQTAHKLASHLYSTSLGHQKLSGESDVTAASVAPSSPDTGTGSVSFTGISKTAPIKDVMRECKLTNSSRPLIKYARSVLAQRELTLPAPELTRLLSVLGDYELTKLGAEIFKKADEAGQANILHYRCFMKTVRNIRDADFTIK